MEGEIRVSQLQRCLSYLPSPNHIDKASLLSATATSENQFARLHQPPKPTVLGRSIEQQISRAKLLIWHAKHRADRDKNNNQNAETLTKPQNKTYQPQPLKLPDLKNDSDSPGSSSEQQLPTPTYCDMSPRMVKVPSNQSPTKRNSSKKDTTPTQSAFKNSQELHHLHQARDIDSFIIDEEDRLQMSIVQEHGDSVLNWALCQGKASEFRILKFLDEGQFGKVYLAQSHRNGVIYSIKSIYRSTLDATTLQQLTREVKIQTFIDHPSIVRIYHFFVDEESAYLVLEPCLGGNLYSYLKKHGRASEKLVREWIKQVCSAVQYMHKNDVIHRDLKPENILLHENMIKICDFGWAVHSPLLRGTLCGTPLYTSPEIVSHKPYDSKIDIWSIGVLTYELLYGNIPFEIRHLDDLTKIVEQQVYFSQEIAVTEAGKDFMSRCMSKNPSERPSIRQLLEHEFLNRMDKYRWTIM